MRIAALKLVLAVIGVSAVIVLGAGRAAAPPPDPCPDPIFHLHTSGGNLLLVTTSFVDGTANFVDSPALSRSGGNTYKPIGEWESYMGNNGNPVCVLTGLSDLHVWLGLRNSDDQGTNFDLKAEVRFNNNLVATAEQLCIKDLTRNPALAKEIIRSFSGVVIPPVGVGVEVSLTLSARIGTPQSTCGGHASATGLRVYYDSADRDSRFDIVLSP